MISMLATQQIGNATLDSRLVALRWDVFPWSLVLDLDVPESEADRAPMRRVWVVFVDVSDVQIPLVARLPTGIWLTSGITIETIDDGMFKACASALLPSFDEENHLTRNPHVEISISAHHVLGVRSNSAAVPGPLGLDYECRNELASDEALVRLLGPMMSARLRAMDHGGP
jgi:hypothetical protein